MMLDSCVYRTFYNVRLTHVLRNGGSIIFHGIYTNSSLCKKKSFVFTIYENHESQNVMNLKF